jgi:PAS domain S-box-containing protein
MLIPDIDQEKAHLEEALRIRHQIAFATGLFQGDVTIHTLLESLAEGVIIIDNSGTILVVNTRAEQMFGYPKNELIGKPYSVLIPERFREVHQEHQAHFFAEPKIRQMGQLLDLSGLRLDGSEFPLEISLCFIETINGVHAMALVSDMTLRKQYERHLREIEELFRIQIEVVRDYAIFTLDSQGIVLNWNVGAERLVGYRAEEIIGKHFSCFYSKEDRTAGKPEEELKRAAVAGQVADEGWLIRKDGSRFWAEVVFTALHDESGAQWGFSTVMHDITMRRQKDEEIERLNYDLTARAAELETANRELEAFNYSAAHDLRQPLTVISSYCQAIKMGYGDKLPDECLNYVQETYNSSLHMNRLIEALLKFSRLGNVELRKEMVDLSSMVHGVVMMLKLTEPERQVDFRIADGITAKADAELLRVILNNLLGNAWKYTAKREQAVIEFGATEIDGKPVYFFIRDNGVGFDKAEAGKLFAPFQRLPGAEEFRGFGIGLATVERVINRHGGSIWAEGEPDKGACFFFALSAD